jgi:hypothetical protein
MVIILVVAVVWLVHDGKKSRQNIRINFDKYKQKFEGGKSCQIIALLHK